jgi:Zn-finger nucleic acid-binding protein
MVMLSIGSSRFPILTSNRHLCKLILRCLARKSPLQRTGLRNMTVQHLRCPRSSTSLTRLRIGGIDTDVCEDCGGLWLDRLELGRFQHPASAFGDALVGHLNQFPPTLIDHTIRLTCPRHPDIVMLRRKFSLAVPVEIDECPECGGIWLDSDELAQIRR